jgi:protein-disulfide isomerase
VKNKLIIIAISVVVLGVGFLVASKMYQASETKKLEFVAKENFRKFVPDYAPTLGTSTPEIYLVEFLDPECESCREFYPMVKMIMEENPGKIQLVIRYAPFHGNSKFAIKIIEAARKQGKFWQALEVLFQYQPQWGDHHHPKPELIWKYLPEAGVDIEKIKEDMNNPEIEAMIKKEMQDGSDLGVRGTPTFFVNGKRLERFGLEPLRELIRENLKD